MSDNEIIAPTHFIRDIITEDVKKGKNDGAVITRFPPEPNGYLHIGHAKSIHLNFGMAREFGGRCHLRFDDTNPEKEDMEYIQAIKTDIQWLGFDWGEHEYYASNYFQKLYEYAVKLIQIGKAYVCSLSAEEIREYRGTLTEPGKESPYRNRSVQENLDLFEKMKTGECEEGTHILRAKIDMASSNINMRDPAIYRIKKAHHPKTGDTWNIYPMYDFAHGLSDAIENITHSLCTLEFEDHRPLYDWFLDVLQTASHPQQIEFSRLNLNYTVMSKRKLLLLVKEKHVHGWDDPRMPTIIGMRRRGFTPASLKNLCDRIGVSKKSGVIDMSILEDCLRDDLNEKAPRAFAILDPIKVIVENYPEDKEEYFDAPNHPQNADMGTRKMPFSRELYIEREDFMENPPKKFFRLSVGSEVRFKYAYLLTCTRVNKNQNGDITEIICNYDPDSKGGSSSDGRKVKGTIHWLSARHAQQAEIRLYDRLFNHPNPAGDKDNDFLTHLNPDSLQIKKTCYIEEILAHAHHEQKYQFERLGYFCADIKDHSVEHPVFNRAVTLRDSWAKAQA